MSKRAKYMLAYISFDFHGRTGLKGVEQFEVLMAELKSYLESNAYFQMDYGDKQVLKEQNGVVRTNCIDSLDRTNVIQSKIAMRILEHQLSDLSLIERNFPLEKLPQVHGTLVNIWADNADTLSVEYSGTPALKTDFTRTGKRTLQGLMNDARFSLQRYVLGNFYDGFNQDSFDLLHGTNEIALADSSFDSLLERLINSDSPSQNEQVNMLFWFAGFGASICATLMYGDDIVDHPRLTYRNPPDF
ncbi:hypothetical protein ACOME3_008402 [Neoechinorhynchus agilis]